MVEERAKMPVVDLSFRRLGRLLGRRIPKKVLLDTLPFLGLDIESESGDGAKVEYSPNRPDYSTEYGIAMGLEGLLGIRTGAVDLRIGEGGEGHRIRADPSVSRIRPFITGICAVGGRAAAVDVAMIRQLVAMQEDLHFGIGRRRKKSAMGIHDLDAVSFPLRYITADRSHEFVHLHGTDPMTVERILSETKAGREYGHLLGGSRPVPVILDSAGMTISLPPVINSSLTAVTAKTKNLFVEVTGTGREDVENALSVAAVTLQRAGFALRRVGISGSGNATPSLSGRTLYLDPGLVSSTLGLDLSPARIISSLKRSRIAASGTAAAAGKRIRCVIPRHRFDILGPMDLVEEVALGYGVARIEPRLSPSGTVGGTTRAVRRTRILDGMLTGLGYTEALNSCLTGTRILYESTGRSPEQAMPVLDSKSGEHTVLRDSVLPGLVDCLSRNVHRQYPQRLYETGTVFLPGSPVRERARLAAVAAHGSADFSEVKSVLLSALRVGFGMDDVRTAASADDPLFAEGRRAGIVAGGRKVGVMGEVDPGVLGRLRIRVPVAGFELDLTGLIFD